MIVLAAGGGGSFPWDYTAQTEPYTHTLTHTHTHTHTQEVKAVLEPRGDLSVSQLQLAPRVPFLCKRSLDLFIVGLELLIIDNIEKKMQSVLFLWGSFTSEQKISSELLYSDFVLCFVV